MSTHVFITGTTNSGTGLLRHLMSASDELSVLPKEGHHYSNSLPRDRGNETKRLFALYPEKFRRRPGEFKPETAAAIKRDLYRKWDTNKPFLVEKSPHHMMRSAAIAEIFPPAKFVIIVRNPFAVCEGIRRRRNHTIGRCATQWAEAHRFLREDMPLISSIVVSYEALIVSTDTTLGAIGSFLGVEFPLADRRSDIKRQNMFKKPFSLNSAPDFNRESISRLSAADQHVIRHVTRDEVKHWGYDSI